MNPKTLDLAPGAPRLLEKAPDDLKPYLKPEAYQSMIEIVTPVCQDLWEVEAFFREKLKQLETLANKEGLLILSASLHPFARAKEQILYEDPRYEAIFKELKIVGRRFIAQGLHVHLGMPSEEEALRLYRHLLAYLPLLLALTTSSPFYEGENTGFHSYRTKLFEVLPLAGLPRDFSSWQEYEELLLHLKRYEIIASIRDLWWDVRIQPALGTVEIRIYDAPGRLNDLLAVVAFTRVLAERLLETSLSPFPREIHLYGKWQAARHGLEGLFVDPQDRRRKFLSEALEELRILLRPKAKALGLSGYWEMLHDLLKRRPASYRMLALRETGATFAEIIAILREEFWS